MGTSTGSIINIHKNSDDTLQTKTSELSGEIAQTRQAMDGTIEALHGRLNPGVLKEELMQHFFDAKQSIKSELKNDFVEVKALFNEGLDEAKESLKDGINETKETLKAGIVETQQHLVAEVKAEFSEAKTALREATIGKVETMVHNTQEKVMSSSRSLVRTVNDNPIPVALMGMGLIWMLANSLLRSNGDGSLSGLEGTISGVGNSIKDKASHMANGAERVTHQATSAIGHATHAATESLGMLASNAKKSIGQAAHLTSETISNYSDKALVQGKRLGGFVEETFDSNPLIVGGILVALGAVIGWTLPITRKEKQWMGRTSDDVMHKTEALASDVLAQVDHATKGFLDGINKNAEQLDGKAATT